MISNKIIYHLPNYTPVSLKVPKKLIRKLPKILFAG